MISLTSSSVSTEIFKIGDMIMRRITNGQSIISIIFLLLVDILWKSMHTLHREKLHMMK